MGVFEDIIGMPATFVMMAINTGIWLYLWNYHVDYPAVGYNFDRVVKDKQVWRTITATFSHISVMHIGFNMMSLFWCGEVEESLGTPKYLEASLIICVLSIWLMVTWDLVQIQFLRRSEQVSRSFTIGYSGVVFGLVALRSAQHWNENQMFFGLFPMPALLMPFVNLVVIQLMLPSASFAGHLSGILVGLSYGFGFFDWVTHYFSLCLFIWIVIVFSISVKTTTSFPVPCLRIRDPRSRDSSIINGRVVYMDDVGADGMQDDIV